jgi:hypothetical protein
VRSSFSVVCPEQSDDPSKGSEPKQALAVRLLRLHGRLLDNACLSQMMSRPQPGMLASPYSSRNVHMRSFHQIAQLPVHFLDRIFQLSMCWTVSKR